MEHDFKLIVCNTLFLRLVNIFAVWGSWGSQGPHGVSVRGAKGIYILNVDLNDSNAF